MPTRSGAAGHLNPGGSRAIGQTARNRLGASGAVGVALAMMGPTTSMAVGVAPVVRSAGMAAPVCFLAGFVAMSLVGLSFASFARRVAGAGSAQDYVGLALGRRAGFMAGWLLLFGYGIMISATMAMTGALSAATLGALGYGGTHLWPWLAVAAGGLATWLCLRDIRITGRAMLVLEWVSMLALIVLAAVILATVSPSARPFPPAGIGLSGVGLGMVFAVLAFVGFEGPATLGEETVDPRRVIPRVMLGTLAAAGAFYVLISYSQVVGFGESGLEGMTRDPSPLGTLARRYVSEPFAILVNAAATISMFSIACSVLAVTARLLMSLSRGGLLPMLARVDRTHGVPARAVVTLAVASIIGFAAFWDAPSPTAYFAALGSIATIAIILVYLGVVTAGLALAVRERRNAAAGFPLAGAALLVWPLFNSLYPIPPWPDRLWPFVVCGWIGLGLVLLFLQPGIGSTPRGERQY